MYTRSVLGTDYMFLWFLEVLGVTEYLLRKRKPDSKVINCRLGKNNEYIMILQYPILLCLIDMINLNQSVLWYMEIVRTLLLFIVTYTIV